MKLTKTQIANITQYTTKFVLAVLVSIGLTICLFKCVPKSTPPAGITPAFTSLENADSLETTNPQYLEHYFVLWDSENKLK